VNCVTASAAVPMMLLASWLGSPGVFSSASDEAKRGLSGPTIKQVGATSSGSGYFVLKKQKHRGCNNRGSDDYFRAGYCRLNDD
jgi:hypothetical protein